MNEVVKGRIVEAFRAGHRPVDIGPRFGCSYKQVENAVREALREAEERVEELVRSMGGEEG